MAVEPMVLLNPATDGVIHETRRAVARDARQMIANIPPISVRGIAQQISVQIVAQRMLLCARLPLSRMSQASRVIPVDEVS